MSSNASKIEARARVRVFVPTYRRHTLLPRALDSLQAQTMPDWTCELHNDDPTDPFPAALAARLGDARIQVHPHDRNLGPTQTFNLFFHPTAEPYYSLLEDDNAWEPEFLATMLDTAGQHPDVTVFWCNQQLWQEDAAGALRATGRTVHPWPAAATPRRIAWGQSTQLAGALHANGAMLVRSRPGESFTTPHVPFALVEAFRERAFPYPLVFVPQPLGRFSLTRQTARSEDRAEWATITTMLTATFLKHAGYEFTRMSALWQAARDHRPVATGGLISAGLADPACRPFLRHSRPIDWIRWFPGIVRRPRTLWRVLRSRRCHADWWQYLERHTAARFASARHPKTTDHDRG